MDIIELRKLDEKFLHQALKCIQRSVEISNAPDYTPSIIQYQLNNHYTLDWITRVIHSRYFITALLDNKVVGTGSLDGDEVKAVFVDPDYQRKGLGRAIMEDLEREGKSKGLKEIKLSSSITGFDFYKALHYQFIKEIVMDHQGEKIVAYLMKKRL